MNLNTEIIDSFLEGKNIENFKNHWIYTSVGQGEFKGKNIFNKPSADNAEKIQILYDEVKKCLEQFEPFNRDIWDMLFPSSSSILESAEIYLTVGLPEPNDATVVKSPSGNDVIILDLGCWTKYMGRTDITKLVRNLITHECSHICIHANNPAVDKDYEEGDYSMKLNSLIFNEGLAHLISFCEDIDEYNWDNEKITEARSKSLLKLKQAVEESETEKQNTYLYDAVFGNYFDKFGAIIGMMYFLDIYREGKSGALLREYSDGHENMISKILNFYRG